VGELHLGDPQGYLGNVGRIVLSDFVVQLGAVERLVEVNRARDETPIKPTLTMCSHQITFAVAKSNFPLQAIPVLVESSKSPPIGRQLCLGLSLIPPFDRARFSLRDVGVLGTADWCGPTCHEPCIDLS
jgi:hypothetical protein